MRHPHGERVRQALAKICGRRVGAVQLPADQVLVKGPTLEPSGAIGWHDISIDELIDKVGIPDRPGPYLYTDLVAAITLKDPAGVTGWRTLIDAWKQAGDID